MKHTKQQTKRAATVLLLLAVTIAGAAPAGVSATGYQIPRLEGTWRVEVTPYNCSTGVSTAPPFQAVLTFGVGGTLTGATSNPAFLPGQRSSDQGVWQRTGFNSARAVSEAFILFASEPRGPIPAFQRGRHRIEQEISLTGKDSFESEAISYFFDEGGTVVMPVLCARARAQRFE